MRPREARENDSGAINRAPTGATGMDSLLERENEKRLEALARRYPERDAVLLPALREIERAKGSVPEEACEYLGGLLDLSPARVRGVLTFYTHYKRPGVGRHVIQVCCTVPCALLEAMSIVEHLEKKLGIRAGETTGDGRFTLLKVECLAACDEAPMMQVDDKYFGRLTPERVDEILERFE